MIYAFIAVIVGCFLLLFLIVVSKNGVPVLMYHKVLPDYSDSLTVSVAQFEEHLQLLQSEGYQIIPLARLTEFVSEKERRLPSKCVFITFDDGYLNNFKYAYPILEKYNVPATIFLPTNYIGHRSTWDKMADDLMSLEQLKSLNAGIISFGLHSHLHQNYKTLWSDEIADDLQNNIRYFMENDLPFVPAFAYPYGGRPKNKIILHQMKEKMQEMGIVMAFRIGNRLNRSFRDVYELQRLDMKGTDSLGIFKKKVKGKMKF